MLPVADKQSGGLRGIQLCFYLPISTLKDVAVAAYNLRLPVSGSYLDEGENTGTGVAVECRRQVPLVGILGIGNKGCGRHYKLIGLRECERLAAEQLCNGIEFLVRVGGSHHLLLFAYVELRGAMQQPLPAHGLGGFQFVV